jgi:hypothetical protein
MALRKILISERVMGDLFQPWHLMVLFFVGSICSGFVLFPLAFWFICKKAGFTPWLAALSVVPLGTLILVFVLAFADWPSQRDAMQAGYVPPLPPTA